MRATQQNVIDLKKELKETQNNLVAQNASLPTGATPSNKFTKKLNWLYSKEKKLDNAVKDAELLATTTLPDLRKELVPLAADYTKLKSERDDIQKNRNAKKKKKR